MDLIVTHFKKYESNRLKKIYRSN